MKNATLPVAVGVAILGCVLAVSANVSSANVNKMLEVERYNRITAEQRLQKAQQQISGLEAELGNAKSKMTSIEQILTDGKMATEQVATEMETIKQERDALKQQLESLQGAQPAAQP